MRLGMIPKVFLWLVVLVAAEEHLEFPLLGEYITTKEMSGDLSEFINNHYIKITLPFSGDGLNVTETGRGTNLRKILPALLILKSVIILGVALLVSINGLLAGLMLSKTVAISIHQDSYRPFRFGYFQDHPANYWKKQDEK